MISVGGRKVYTSEIESAVDSSVPSAGLRRAGRPRRLRRARLVLMMEVQGKPRTTAPSPTARPPSPWRRPGRARRVPVPAARCAAQDAERQDPALPLPRHACRGRPGAGRPRGVLTGRHRRACRRRDRVVPTAARPAPRPRRAGPGGPRRRGRSAPARHGTSTPGRPAAR
ncbi:hypothetical protein NKH77_54020 [Streptomyces sp. M19]